MRMRNTSKVSRYVRNITLFIRVFMEKISNFYEYFISQRYLTYMSVDIFHENYLLRRIYTLNTVYTVFIYTNIMIEIFFFLSPCLT